MDLLWVFLRLPWGLPSESREKEMLSSWLFWRLVLLLLLSTKDGSGLFLFWPFLVGRGTGQSTILRKSFILCASASVWYLPRRLLSS
jgi:hypothetical protein